MTECNILLTFQSYNLKSCNMYIFICLCHIILSQKITQWLLCISFLPLPYFPSFFYRFFLQIFTLFLLILNLFLSTFYHFFVFAFITNLVFMELKKFTCLCKTFTLSFIYQILVSYDIRLFYTIFKWVRNNVYNCTVYIIPYSFISPFYSFFLHFLLVLLFKLSHYEQCKDIIYILRRLK